MEIPGVRLRMPSPQFRFDCLLSRESVDGQTMASGERVLVKDQSTAAQNGIYTVTTVGDGSSNWVITRATDFDSSSEITSGAFTFVETGSSLADSGWVMTTDGTVTVGTTSLAWSQFSGAGQITAGDGMTKSGNTLNVGAGSNLLVNADAGEILSKGVVKLMISKYRYKINILAMRVIHPINKIIFDSL